ncbi:6-hydroxymethylpterin diphosphokinase MptE-like protein [Clostridium sp. E02]|uniref:motility associated factor glycosyltransferase family protein n=1 Tax=Clostridium sp. E02 TaxID=2487134 RepID=UPI0013DE0C95|nr:6-hydroxymethylpterin diphosphokinase MptE-like protein [Clostridium sp. E02]
MKKCKTSDGFHVYRIHRNHRFYYLADRHDYKQEITNLTNTLSGLTFDSIVFLFGIDTGAYLEDLKKLLCAQNQVFIFEPNHCVYQKYNSDLGNHIQLIYYEEKEVKKKFHDTIQFKNINHIYFYAFGNYKRIYQKEYDSLIRHLDWTMLNATSQIDLAKRFQTVFIKNMIANMDIVTHSTPIHNYLFTNVDVPAIVVSGGSSLDQNLKDMVKYRDKLKNFFIITGTRTVDALISSGIQPDLIVSVDPVNANYEMMKHHLDLPVPLAYYEYSNRYLLREYQGEKVFLSLLFSKILIGYQHLKGVYCGGSVAHACIDIVNLLGCSPIFFIGQDFAYTNHKHHADSATFPYDSSLKYKTQISVKDIYGNQTGTTITLDHFRKNLESYITKYKDQSRVQFYNCSYGAVIEGAPHKEIKEVLETISFSGTKTPLTTSHDLVFPSEEMITTLLDYINDTLTKASQGLELTSQILSEHQNKSLLKIPDDDLDLQKILYILQIVNNFENNPISRFFGGYLTEFLYEMKEKNSSMLAKDYDKLTSNLQYQAGFFHAYFELLTKILLEIKETTLLTVSEFYPSHIVK